MVAHERMVRTITRGVTWRVVALTVAFVGAMLLGQPIQVALVASLAYNAVQFLLHLAHDRVWANIRWGERLAVSA